MIIRYPPDSLLRPRNPLINDAAHSTFHSPRTAADGTRKAALLPSRIYSLPNRCKDSSLLSYQQVGRVFGSGLEISTASGISPSIETRSAGLRFGSRFTKVSTAGSARKFEAHATRTPPRLFHWPPNNRWEGPRVKQRMTLPREGGMEEDCLATGSGLSSTQEILVSKVAIPTYLEIIDFIARGTTPQAVVDYQPSPEFRSASLS